MLNLSFDVDLAGGSWFPGFFKKYSLSSQLAPNNLVMNRFRFDPKCYTFQPPGDLFFLQLASGRRHQKEPWWVVTTLMGGVPHVDQRMFVLSTVSQLTPLGRKAMRENILARPRRVHRMRLFWQYPGPCSCCKALMFPASYHSLPQFWSCHF